MSEKISTLKLQELFYKVMNDLELAQDQLYTDGVEAAMKVYCRNQRESYIQEFNNILQVDKSPKAWFTLHYGELNIPAYHSFMPSKGYQVTNVGKTYIVDDVRLDIDTGETHVYLIDGEQS